MCNTDCSIVLVARSDPKGPPVQQQIREHPAHGHDPTGNDVPRINGVVCRENRDVGAGAVDGGSVQKIETLSSWIALDWFFCARRRGSLVPWKPAARRAAAASSRVPRRISRESGRRPDPATVGPYLFRLGHAGWYLADVALVLAGAANATLPQRMFIGARARRDMHAE